MLKLDYIWPGYFSKWQMMAKLVFWKTILYSSHFNFCIYISEFQLTLNWCTCKNWSNLNTEPCFEKLILSSFSVLKNTFNSQISASIALLNMCFQIMSSFTDPDFAYTTISNTTGCHAGGFWMWTKDGWKYWWESWWSV